MRVKHFTGEPKSRQRHPAEQGPEIRCAVIDLPNECPPDKIILVILNCLLAGCESELKRRNPSLARDVLPKCRVSNPLSIHRLIASHNRVLLGRSRWNA